jgi:transposase-like protein
MEVLIANEREGDTEVEEAVRHAVETALTEKQREAVELHFFEGLSQSEIARRLGVSQQVIQKRLFGDRRGGRLVGGAIATLRQALSPLANERTAVRARRS